MFDLQVLAYQAEITRISTMMYARDTSGAVYPGSGIRDLYRLEMENFASPLTVGFYVLSMLVVGSHLWHGIGSGVQSLGADLPRWTPRLLVASRAIAALIAGGFIVIALCAHFAGRS